MESHGALRNYISEEEDVVKAFENVVKQKNDAIGCMQKSGVLDCSGMEDRELFQKLHEVNQQHSLALQDFIQKYKSYIKTLKELLSKYEYLAGLEKNVKELELRFSKGKISQNSLNDAKVARDNAAQQLDNSKGPMMKECLRILTQSWVEFYQIGAQALSKQLEVLGGKSSSSQPVQFGQPPNFHPFVLPQSSATNR